MASVAIIFDSLTRYMNRLPEKKFPNPWVIKIQQADSKPIQKHVLAKIPLINLDVEDNYMLAVQDIKVYFKVILIKIIQ